MTAPRLVRSPEVAELRAFCAAADLGSLGRAAVLLRVSQPALSKRLRALEGLFGSQLLERSPRGVELTPAGRRLYVEARKLLTQVDAVEELAVRLQAETEPVRLGASHTIAEHVLPSMLARFKSRHGHLAVELVAGNSDFVRELVVAGRVDVGIAAHGPYDGPEAVDSRAFIGDEVVVAAPLGHRWAELDEVPLAEFAATSLVMRDPGSNARQTVEGALSERGLELAEPLAELGSTEAAIDCALSRGVPVLLSTLALEGSGAELVPRRVSGLSLARQFVLLFGSSENLRPPARALVSYLLERAARRAAGRPAARLSEMERRGGGHPRSAPPRGLRRRPRPGSGAAP